MPVHALHNRQPQIALLSLDVAIVLASLYFWLIQAGALLQEAGRTSQALVGAIFVVGGTIIAARLAAPRVDRLLGWTVQRLLGVSLITLCIGIALTYALPLSPLPLSTSSIEVDALGRTSSPTGGTEVWVQLIKDGKPVPSSEMKASGTWKQVDGFLVSSSGSTPNSLSWSGASTSDLQLRFVSHPWSGLARVSWDGKSQELNLYSAQGRDVVINGSDNRPARHFLDPSRRSMVQRVTQVAQAIVLGAMITGLFLLLALRPPKIATVPAEASLLGLTVLSSLPLLITGSVLLTMFSPAVMSTDSVDQWLQATNWKFNDVHAIIYTLYLAAFQKTTGSPVGAALVQLLGLALASGWLIAAITRLARAPRWTALLAGILMAALPILPLTAVTLWKDVPYTACAIALAAWLVSLAGQPGQSRFGWPAAALFSLLAAACALLRHNGPAVALAAIIGLTLFPHLRRKAAAVLLMVLALVFAVKGPLSNALDVKRVGASHIAYSHHIAAHMASGGHLRNPDDAKLLSSINHEEADWRYNCAQVNPTVFSPHFDMAEAIRNQDRLLRIWADLALDQPMVELGHIACTSALIWRLSAAPGEPIYLYTFGVRGNGSGGVLWVEPMAGSPRPESWLPNAAQDFGGAIQGVELQSLWRPAGYMYLTLFIVGVAALKTRNRWLLLVLLVPAAHTAFLAIANVAQDARYQLPVYHLFFAVLPMLAARIAPAPSRPAR